LAPECHLIASKPFEDVVVEIGEAQEALRDIETRFGHRQFRLRCGVSHGFAIDGIVDSISIPGFDSAWGSADPQCCHERAVSRGLRCLVRLQPVQDFTLDLKKTGLNQGRAPQSPQQARKPKDQFALDRRFRVIVSGDCLLEGFVVFGILEGLDRGGRRSSRRSAVE